MKNLAALILIAIGISSYGQPIDSASVDSVRELAIAGKIEAMNSLGNHFRSSNIGDSANFWLESSLSKAREVSDDYWMAKNLSDLSETAFRPFGDFQTSLIYAQEALEYAFKTNDSSLLAAIHFSIGRAHSDQGDYAKSLEELRKSLVLYEGSKDSLQLAKVYNSLGIGYSRQENYENALKYYRKALQQSQRYKKKINSAFSTNNIGTTYQRMDLHDSAIYYFRLGLSLEKEAPYPFVKAPLLNNLGTSLRKTGLIDSSIFYHNQALEIGKSHNSKSQIGWCELGLSHAYYALGDLSLAIKFANSAYEYSLEGKEREISRQTTEILYKAHAAENRHKKSFENLLLFKAYSDTLLNAEGLRKQAALEYKIQQEQSEFELLAQEKVFQAKIDQEERIRNIVIVGLLLVIILLFALLREYWRKRKTNKVLEANNLLIQKQADKLERLNKSKDKFFALISHDLRGPMAVFQSTAFVIKHSIKEKQYTDLQYFANNLEEVATNVTRLLDNLLNWALKEQKQLSTKMEEVKLTDQIEEVRKIYEPLMSTKNISLSNEVESDVELYADKNGLSTILRNLLNNSIKFTKSGGSITISSKDHEDELEVCVSDTGIGMDKEECDRMFNKTEIGKASFGTEGEKGVGLGLQLVKDFIEMHEGRLEVESKKGVGSQFHVFLPKN